MSDVQLYRYLWIWPQQDERGDWYCEVTNKIGETIVMTETVPTRSEAVRIAKRQINKYAAARRLADDVPVP